MTPTIRRSSTRSGRLAQVCFMGGRHELWEPLYAALARLWPEPPPLLALTVDMFADPARTGVAALPRLLAALLTVTIEVDPSVIDNTPAPRCTPTVSRRCASPCGGRC